MGQPLTGRRKVAHLHPVNAVIGQFQPLRLRPDLGALWENFIVNERRRKLDYARLERKDYFWHTYGQQEIDRMEVDAEGVPEGFECKWREQSWRPPTAWSKAYPDARVHLVHHRNFMWHIG